MKTLLLTALALTLTAASVLEAQGQRRRSRSRTASRQTTAATTQPAASTAAPAATKTASGLTYLITRRGTGRQPKQGEVVLVHYTGTLTNGTKFDSSRERSDPIAFKLGAGRVIKGWDEGVAQLRVGDQAVLVIPPQLGYGARGAGNGLIPPDATLIFIIEVMDVKATSLSEMLSETLKAKGLEAMVSQYRELKQKGLQDVYSSESDINGLGYRLLREKMFKEAIEVLKLNVEAHPRSANVYDSLAEAYLASGDRAQAIENYRKALEIDPQMQSAKAALEALTGN